MLDPFTAWSRLMSAAWDMSRTSQRASEAMTASNDVFSKRTDMIAAAMRSPLTGDYAELSKMVPEKVEAFSKSGSAMAREWWSMQSALLAEMQHFGGFFLRDRPPSMAELTELSARSTTYFLRSVERVAQFGGLGLAPVHATVTANSRRLRKQPRK
jgi:hypothetical protein